MADVIMSVRTTMKRDTTANWNSKRDFVPLLGELIIYTDFTERDGVPIPNIKIGDGSAFCIDLPFIYSADDTELRKHVADHIKHVTSDDRTRWDNKLNCELVGENLILNKD